MKSDICTNSNCSYLAEIDDSRPPVFDWGRATSWTFQICKKKFCTFFRNFSRFRDFHILCTRYRLWNRTWKNLNIHLKGRKITSFDPSDYWHGPSTLQRGVVFFHDISYHISSWRRASVSEARLPNSYLVNPLNCGKCALMFIKYMQYHDLLQIGDFSINNHSKKLVPCAVLKCAKNRLPKALCFPELNAPMFHFLTHSLTGFWTKS